jgi:8-oxo-dGTP pyrophosphatase MutT (NUDIX family)
MLSSYSGDYCLPGGTKDLTDASLMMTAVRELEEEICLKNGDYKIIGQLDDFTNGKKRLVRPFVASVTKRTLEKQQCCPNSEVQSIYLFPFQEVFKIQESTDMHNPSYRYPSYRYHNEHIYLWGLTASIIVHLANVISGETRPVGRHCNFYVNKQ